MSKPNTIETTVDSETKWEVQEFLAYEAELLDNFELSDWLALLTDDVQYKIPNRLSAAVGEENPEFSDKGYHMNETKSTLESRVTRYEKEYAWAENPRTRTRRFVTNIRLERLNETELAVTSNLLLFRLEKDKTDPSVVSAEREDTLRRVDDEFKLAERVVYLDFTAMGTKSLTGFL